MYISLPRCYYCSYGVIFSVCVCVRENVFGESYGNVVGDRNVMHKWLFNSIVFGTYLSLIEIDC